MVDRAELQRQFLSLCKWAFLVTACATAPLAITWQDATVGDRIAELAGIALWVVIMTVLEHRARPSSSRLALGASILAGAKLLALLVFGPLFPFWFYFPVLMASRAAISDDGSPQGAFLLTALCGSVDLALVFTFAFLISRFERKVT